MAFDDMSYNAILSDPLRRVKYYPRIIKKLPLYGTAEAGPSQDFGRVMQALDDRPSGR